MQVVRLSESSGSSHLATAVLPYRHAQDKGGFDVIPARSFWLARLGEQSQLDLHRYGSHLIVILSGALTLYAEGDKQVQLLPGDVLCSDIGTPGVVRTEWRSDVWVLLISTPGWQPEYGALHVVRVGEPRSGRPSMTWVHDDMNWSRSEPFRWPSGLTTVPEVSEWPTSVGAFVTRRDYGLDGYATGVWHNGPRRQFAVTLNGCAELETSDGSVSRPVAGDLTLIDDAVGPGHITRGHGDRWMLFLTVAAGELPMMAEL
jgi:quercetin dioxygenase-like cupin family protein